MASKYYTAVEHARRNTVLLILAANALLVIFTLLKGYPFIWSEFDKEKNAWTFGKSAQMIVVAVIAYINYLLTISRQGSGCSKRQAWPWAFLAGAFLFLAFDDMLILHERGGHALENALPALSRQHIAVYMDDLLEFAYSAAAVLFGVIFLRRLMPDRTSFRLYIYGAAALALATAIGLPPKVKALPFPTALIQILHLVSVCMFLLCFVNCTSAELVSAVGAGQEEPGLKSVKSEV